MTDAPPPSPGTRAPKPIGRPRKVSFLTYLRLFRRDILSAQPDHLFSAQMAEFKTPFFRSYLINDQSLIKRVLKERPLDFPKSDRVSEGLRPLLGQHSVFLTNGVVWQAQRRIIDPAFEGGRLRDTFPAMQAAGAAALERLGQGGKFDIEGEMSHLAADVIFRTLFSIPITEDIAHETFAAFRSYQRLQPILNPAALLVWPKFLPRWHRPGVRREAARIRKLIEQLVARRLGEIAQGSAPEDLASKILSARDPETGKGFDAAEMVDQVAIFFLAGHETSAAALSWALYLLTLRPDLQDDVAREAREFMASPDFSRLSVLRLTRNVFRESLRLYPPVPMMVRECAKDETFRARQAKRGAQVVISPWHLHRHTEVWSHPDDFDPMRYETEAGQACMRDAFLPFSTGPRVCIGAGFAMIEGVLLLAMILARFRVEAVGPAPVPVAHLTIRAKDGINLKLTIRP